VNKRDRIDSTAALLQVIREGAPDGTAAPESSAAAPVPETPAPTVPAGKFRKIRVPRPSLSALFGFNGLRRGSTLGVDLREDSLAVIRMARNGPARVLDAARFPYPAGVQPGAPGFPAFLAACLRRFNGGLAQAQVWTLVRSSDFDILPVLVPKMPARRVEEGAYWKLQKEQKFSDAEQVLDLRVQGPVSDKGVDKIEVLACLARREEVETQRRIFAEAGIALAGVTTIPGAHQNVLRNAPSAGAGEVAATLHMDAGFSCITISSGGKLLFCRTIKSGANSMAEALLENLGSAVEVQTLDLAAARRLLAVKLLGLPEAEGRPGADLDPETVFQIVEPAMDRLARQAERTLDYFFANFGKRVERLYFSGEMFACAQVRNFMAGQLGLHEEVFDPLAGIPGLDRFGLAGERDRLDMAQAAALAASDQTVTLNLLRNYRDRAAVNRRKRLGDLLAAAAALLMVLAGGLYFLGEVQVRSRMAELEGLKKSLERYQPPMETTRLLNMASEVVRKRSEFKEAADRLETLAVVAELANVLPANVKVLNLTLDFGKEQPQEAAPAKPAAAKAPQGGEAKPAAASSRIMVVDAMILGDPGEFDTTLSRFLIDLDASPLFGTPVIHSNAVQDFVPDGKVMHVILHISLA
jgi:Tfp pilus assembly PilM family ATPase